MHIYKEYIHIDTSFIFTIFDPPDKNIPINAPLHKQRRSSKSRPASRRCRDRYFAARGAMQSNGVAMARSLVDLTPNTGGGGM